MKLGREINWGGEGCSTSDRQGLSHSLQCLSFELEGAVRERHRASRVMVGFRVPKCGGSKLTVRHTVLFRRVLWRSFPRRKLQPSSFPAQGGITAPTAHNTSPPFDLPLRSTSLCNPMEVLDVFSSFLPTELRAPGSL